LLHVKQHGIIISMKHEVHLIQSAKEDLEYFESSAQRIITNGIEMFLMTDANVETKRRKQLRPNPLAPWELRIGDYRVFYDIEEEDIVRILAVGKKVHNDLYIRGIKVEI
jgi:mRNA-degrading endonuclease RelE of RelBE toxin-antitoxin system